MLDDKTCEYNEKKGKTAIKILDSMTDELKNTLSNDFEITQYPVNAKNSYLSIISKTEPNVFEVDIYWQDNEADKLNLKIELNKTSDMKLIKVVKNIIEIYQFYAIRISS